MFRIVLALFLIASVIPAASAAEQNKESNRAVTDGCMYNGKFFTRGAMFCSAKLIVIQCRIPPKNSQEELGTQLQWVSSTAHECESSESKTPQ